jgi:hypothetical protein
MPKSYEIRDQPPQGDEYRNKKPDDRKVEHRQAHEDKKETAAWEEGKRPPK